MQARPCLHAFLRLALQNFQASYAIRLCEQARLAPCALFQRELQHLLHGALEEAAASKGSLASRSLIAEIVHLLQPFPERLNILAKVMLYPCLGCAGVSCESCVLVAASTDRTANGVLSCQALVCDRWTCAGILQGSTRRKRPAVSALLPDAGSGRSTERGARAVSQRTVRAVDG